MALKEDQNTNRDTFNKLNTIALVLTGLSILSFWGLDLINHYFYTPDFSELYTFLLLGVTIIAVSGGMMSIVALLRGSSVKERLVSGACVVICVATIGMSLLGAALYNLL